MASALVERHFSFGQSLTHSMPVQSTRQVPDPGEASETDEAPVPGCLPPISCVSSDLLCGQGLEWLSRSGIFTSVDSGSQEGTGRAAAVLTGFPHPQGRAMATAQNAPQGRNVLYRCCPIAEPLSGGSGHLTRSFPAAPRGSVSGPLWLPPVHS